MKKIKYLLASLLCVSMMSLSSCKDTSKSLLISEIFEGEGNDRALELYNKNSEAINLNGYKINIHTGLSTTPTYSISLKGKLNGESTLVICHPSSKQETKDKSDIESSDLNFNGSQAMTLTYEELVEKLVNRIRATVE